MDAKYDLLCEMDEVLDLFKFDLDDESYDRAKKTIASLRTDLSEGERENAYLAVLKGTFLYSIGQDEKRIVTFLKEIGTT